MVDWSLGGQQSYKLLWLAEFDLAILSWVVDSCTSLPSFYDGEVHIDEFRALWDNWQARADSSIRVVHKTTGP